MGAAPELQREIQESSMNVYREVHIHARSLRTRLAEVQQLSPAARPTFTPEVAQRRALSEQFLKVQLRQVRELVDACGNAQTVCYEPCLAAQGISPSDIEC